MKWGGKIYSTVSIKRKLPRHKQEIAISILKNKIIKPKKYNK